MGREIGHARKTQPEIKMREGNGIDIDLDTKETEETKMQKKQRYNKYTCINDKWKMNGFGCAEIAAVHMLAELGNHANCRASFREMLASIQIARRIRSKLNCETHRHRQTIKS